MKKIISLLILFAIVFLFAGCEEGATPDNYTINYYDAETFEKALNEGKNVKGKVVQFLVLEYAPDSILGINCHAGEHLNFIFEEELAVESGDTIIAHVTDEASKVILVGSWKIRCEVFEIIEAEEETKPTVSTVPETKPTQPSEAPTKPTEPTEAPTKPTESIKTTTKPTANQETGIRVSYSTNDYETAKKGNTGVYSYKSKSGAYDVYWIVDFDLGVVYNFADGNGDTTCDEVKIISGDLNDRMTITWYEGGDQWSWHLHFKYKNQPETLIINDHYGSAMEFTATNLNGALSVRNTKTIRKCYQEASNTTQQSSKTQKELIIEAAQKYRNDNEDIILSVYELYEHLTNLGYNEDICLDICFNEGVEGFYDGSAMYDYERINMFYNQGFSREAIINFYIDTLSYEDAEYLVDGCLEGRKLTYGYVDDEFQLVEHD